MGKQDEEMFRYLEDEKRFADLFNALQFDGEQVVNPQKLKEASERYTVSRTRKGRGRFRDVKKRLENGAFLRILAVENQNHVDYTMPWRIMEYDNLEYGKQVRKIQSRNDRERQEPDAAKLEPAELLCGFRKSDRLAPTYTICLYHGQEKWDGPRSLRDMIEFGEDGEPWKQIFADYPMRLVCVNELTDFSCFKSSLGQLFQVLALQNDKQAMNELFEHNPEYHHIDRDTMEAIAIMTNSEELLENMEDYENEEGGYEMCKAFRELIEDGRQEGRKEGIQEGMRAAFTTLVKDGVLSLTEAAKRAGMPEAEFKKLLG